MGSEAGEGAGVGRDLPFDSPGYYRVRRISVCLDVRLHQIRTCETGIAEEKSEPPGGCGRAAVEGSCTVGCVYGDNTETVRNRLLYVLPGFAGTGGPDYYDLDSVCRVSLRAKSAERSPDRHLLRRLVNNHTYFGLWVSVNQGNLISLAQS